MTAEIDDRLQHIEAQLDKLSLQMVALIKMRLHPTADADVPEQRWDFIAHSSHGDRTVGQVEARSSGEAYLQAFNKAELVFTHDNELISSLEVVPRDLP